MYHTSDSTNDILHNGYIQIRPYNFLQNIVPGFYFCLWFTYCAPFILWLGSCTSLLCCSYSCIVLCRKQIVLKFEEYTFGVAQAVSELAPLFPKVSDYLSDSLRKAYHVFICQILIYLPVGSLVCHTATKQTWLPQQCTSGMCLLEFEIFNYLSSIMLTIIIL